MRLLVASRVLRRRRVRRALIAKLLKNRSESEGEGEDEYDDETEDDGGDEGSGVEHHLARLLVGKRIVRRRRTRRAALVRFLRNRD
jgi:hypothetical protein